MARTKSIERDALLDAAEEIVRTRGAAALTIDAIAKAAGITKGGVQYTFNSKDALITAMFERWDGSYLERFNEIAGKDSSPIGGIRAHIIATGQADETSNSKAASLLASLLQAPENLATTREWYRSRLQGLDATTEEGREARIAFLAAEGAFLLRYLGLMDINDSEWESIFRDVGRLDAIASGK